MTQNRRIFLNIVATYGRSLLGLACGLFSARWILMALGASDFGLYGLVGGLTVFISFVNELLANSIGRYYAYSIGRTKMDSNSGVGNESLEECRHWFNVAVLIQMFIPVVLVLVGYPVGIWAVRNFLEIPIGRLDACVWIFRFACLSCFVGMVNVPFRAMYVAKQEIAELTLYSVAQTILNFLFAYYMVSNPGEWLVCYGLWMAAVPIFIQMCICLRAFFAFEECQLRISYMIDKRRISAIGGFALCQLFGNLAGLLKDQGVAIVVNKYYGASINASMVVANQLSAQTQNLSSAMQGAFQPAIATAYGAGNLDKTREMALFACRFGVLLVLVFVLPLSLEISEVMRLWLKTPPMWASQFCMCMLIMVVVDKATIGHVLAVNASGKIAAYHFVLGCIFILSLPLAWFVAIFNLPPWYVCVAMTFILMVCAVGRILFAHGIVGMSIKKWLSRVVAPMSCVSILVLGAGFVPHLFMEQSFARIVVTTSLCLISFMPLAWFVVLDSSERSYICNRVRSFVE